MMRNISVARVIATLAPLARRLAKACTPPRPAYCDIVAEGFLAYVDRLLMEGPLFPDIKPDRFGRRGGKATRRAGCEA